MGLENNFINGIFKKEAKIRFLCEVEINGKNELCYVPSSCKLGRFLELEDKEVLLQPIQKKNARTKYSIYAVKVGQQYILLNLLQCNTIIEEQLHRRIFSFLGIRKHFTKESVINGYKSDLFIQDTNTVVEVKSLLSFERQTRFPSVDSKRVIQQLEKLSTLLENGYNVCYIVVSLNPRVKELSLDESKDLYCCLFLECLRKGMLCCAVSVCFKDGRFELKSRIKVNL